MRCLSSAAPGVVRRCGKVAAAVLPVAKVIATGLLVSACAQSQAAYDQPYNVGARQMSQVAVAAPAKVEMEADGLAVQPPPRVRKRAEPDDPSEPFSRNYGPAPDGVEPVNMPAEPLHRADVAPPQLRSRITPMSPEEQHAIMARAMAEHERRYP